MSDQGDRCKCGARVMGCDIVRVREGVDLYIYTCGVCGSQVEYKYDGDPKKV